MESEPVTPDGRGRRRVILWSAVGVVVLGLIVTLVLLRLLSPATPSAEPTDSSGYPTAEVTPSRTAAPVPSPIVTPSRAAGPTKTGDNAPKQRLDPVSLDSSVEGEDGIRVALTAIESVQGEAAQPGEVSGPAIRVTVTITNATKRAFDAGASVVNAYYGAQLTPAGTLVKPGGVPLYGRLAPGESTYGVYLFRIPVDARGDVTITVDYQSAAPTVVFHGSAA